MESKTPENELNDLMSESEVEEFIEKWCGGEIALHSAVRTLIAEKEISLADLMKDSRINRNYGYNIINGRRKNPSRDKVLAISIAAKLTVRETQEMLLIAGVGGLYFRRERDVRIAACLNNKVGDVLKVNIMLESKGLEPLDV